MADKEKLEDEVISEYPEAWGEMEKFNIMGSA